MAKTECVFAQQKLLGMFRPKPSLSVLVRSPLFIIVHLFSHKNCLFGFQVAFKKVEISEHFWFHLFLKLNFSPWHVTIRSGLPLKIHWRATKCFLGVRAARNCIIWPHLDPRNGCMGSHKGWANATLHLYFNGTQLQYLAQPLRKVQLVLVRAHVNNEEAASLAQVLWPLQITDWWGRREWDSNQSNIGGQRIGHQLLKPR